MTLGRLHFGNDSKKTTSFLQGLLIAKQITIILLRKNHFSGPLPLFYPAPWIFEGLYIATDFELDIYFFFKKACRLNQEIFHLENNKSVHGMENALKFQENKGI